MTAQPSANGKAHRQPLGDVSDVSPTVNHDPNGKFARGNAAAKGNPFARKMARLRSALLDGTTPEQIAELGEKLRMAALAGDVASATLWLSYVCGKPGKCVHPNAVDLHELQLLRECPSLAELLVLMKSHQAATAVSILGTVMSDGPAALDRFQTDAEVMFADAGDESQAAKAALLREVAAIELKRAGRIPKSE